MATVINNPSSPTPGGDNSSGWVVGIIVLILVVVLGFLFLPRLMGSSTTNTIVVPGETGTTPGTSNSTTNNTTNNTTNSTTTVQVGGGLTGSTTIPH